MAGRIKARHAFFMNDDVKTSIIGIDRGVKNAYVRTNTDKMQFGNTTCSQLSIRDQFPQRRYNVFYPSK